jgi:hypothetical protein
VKLILSLVVVASLIIQPLTAQSSSDWQRVLNLRPGDAILVATKTGEHYQGDLVRVSQDSLVFDSDERGFPGRIHRQRDLRQPEIKEIRRRRQGASTLAATAIGAAAGAGLGAAIDAAARSNEDQGLATVVFTFLGALLGWAIGKHTNIIKGERIYTIP